jgi:putative chitinase
MTTIDRSRWLAVLTTCGVAAERAANWAPLFEAQVQPAAFNLGLQELDDFVSTILHESVNLKRLKEDLNYTAQRLLEVWPQRFTGVADAMRYEFNPEALAEKVYGRRADLGNDRPGDGWKYKGRGLIQVTGKANYALLERITGMPLVEHPDMLEQPELALRCSLLWWEAKVPDSAIDTVERVCRVVNGGTVGLNERRAKYERAHNELENLA